MRKLAVAFAVVVLLALASGAQAVDLTAGWYANVVGGSIYYDGQSFQPSPLSFTILIGSYGPFEVTQNQYYSRVSVPTDVLSVLPGTYVFRLQDLKDTTHAYRVRGEFETNYDASRMRIELVKTDSDYTPVQVLWSQDQSGYQIGILDVYCSVDPDEWVAVRVIAVPEPTSLFVLLCGLAGITAIKKRQR